MAKPVLFRSNDRVRNGKPSLQAVRLSGQRGETFVGGATPRRIAHVDRYECKRETGGFRDEGDKNRHSRKAIQRALRVNIKSASSILAPRSPDIPPSFHTAPCRSAAASPQRSRASLIYSSFPTRLAEGSWSRRNLSPPKRNRRSTSLASAPGRVKPMVRRPGVTVSK